MRRGPSVLQLSCVAILSGVLGMGLAYPERLESPPSSSERLIMDQRATIRELREEIRRLRENGR